ncbi:MAG TPA: SDR family NAD(P)-dependent oxidoreductase [Blastocatellia bacterium]|jgi:3-oxoacyl-[acyl-carrier protein] reductase|nr:SDR family NAD(P)-dependent oxidoreductase [Blastocatellia bacterium]
MSFLDFTDQVILITGASRGVGAAAAVGFARAGAAGVVVNYRGRREAALEVAAEVERAGAAALVLQADVARADEARSLVNQTLERFGRLDVLVANAGVWPASGRPVTDLDAAQWAETIRVNLDGVYHVCREAARVFARERRGNIVTVSSTAGQRGEAGHADYAASKGAVISLTKSLASELGPGGVRVNSVAPGWVDTEMSAPALRAGAAQLAEIHRAIPLGRVATAEDIAGPILFLASDLARHITGEILNVNGGSVLCG